MTRDVVAELARELSRDREDVIEHLKERSAIRQYDGGMSRAEADAAAIEDVRGMLTVKLPDSGSGW